MGKKKSVDTVKARSWEREAEDKQDFGEKAKRYKLAGDAWRRGKDFESAIASYELAKKCAEKGGADDNYIERLNKKIQETYDQQQKGNTKKGGLLERLGFASLSILFLTTALFFTSFSFTGYVIGGLVQGNSRWIGIIFFILGLVFTFLYFQNKKSL